MTDEDRKRAAQAILEFPFFEQLWDELEEAAVNACLFADFTDHEKRMAHAFQARAIRDVRSRIRSIANDGQTETVSRRAPA